MSMDFSSWCTSFRFEGVTPLFQELDRLLGVKNVMAYTQRFPLESILLFQDRFNPPRQGPNGLPRNGPRCIHGPEAWMEGLRQKGWTLATIMLILIASWRCGTIATLTGQGDNQVIYLRLPKRETLEGLRLTRSQYIRWYQTTLEELCTKAGITLKLEETWVSTSLLEYGREFFFKGAQVSSAIKRISRVASEANQTIPSFNGDISGIFSAGMGTAQKDHVPHHAYWTTILEASIAMIDRFPSLSKHPVEFRVALLSVTRTLGGWPITLFPQFCTRSVQDPLTCSLHLVRTLMKSPRHREHILRVATTRVRNPDPAMLIKDPQSLPLHMPRQPENYLKEKIAEGLPKIIVNKELKPLFAEEVEGHKTSLIGDLMAIRPCNPKLLSKLLTLSNVGKQEALISKFSSTRSIQNIACREWSSEIQVLKDIAGMENTTLSHILSRGSDVRLSLMNDNMCLTAYAQELREVSWGIPLEGVTMPAQQEQAQVCLWDKVPLDMYDYAISLSTEGAPGTAWDLDRGPVPPYIGAPTRIRAKRQPLQEMESYSFTKTLSQALQLRSWVKGDAGMTKLLDTIIQEKTDASTEELDRRTAHVYSGSLTHRLSCPTMSRGGQSNSTSNMASHIRVSSSTASAYAKKGEDYTICFQSVFLYGIAVLNLLYHRFKCLPPRLAVVLSRKCCTWLIPPESFTLAESLYPGVPIPTAIMHVEPTKESGLPYTPRGLDVQGSYAAQMAYKFAVWILNRRDTTRISTLEHRALGDVLTPPFVNLSEMSRVNLSALIEQLVCYLVIMDIEFRIRPQHVLAELKSSQTRTGFDDLIDSLELSGLTHVFCSIAHSTPQDLKSRDGWRISLSTVIDAELGKGLRSVVHDNMVIIPEEMEHLFLKWYRTLASLLSHKVDGTLLKSMDAQPLVDLLEEAARKANLHPLIWPPISLSEEESVAGTRRLPRPGRRVMMGMAEPNTSCPEGLNPEPASPSVEEMMFCVQGDRVTNQLYEVILKLKQVDLFSGPIWLYTLGDPGGNLFSLVSHLLPRQIRGGFPRWASEEGDVEASLETGPRCITGDPCDMVYDHNEFLANIDTRGPARMSLEGSNVTVWIVRPRWEGCVDTSRGCLLLTDSTRGFGPGWSLRIRVVFQRVEGVRSAVWSLWQRGAWDKGVKEYHLGLGNASPELSLRRPLECASAGKRMGLECFGLLSSVHHFIQGVPDTRLRLIQMIRRSYTSCVDMIPDIMTPGVAFGFLEPVRERDDAIRRAIVNRVAVLGLIMGMLSAPDPRLCSKERSWIKFHIHFSYGKATRLCQRRCGRDEVDRGMVFVRKYRKPDLSRWWKPCLLLVVSLKEGARPGYGDIKAVVA
uniref:RNA-directed RNA polymerase n=1 Tax=Hangzhou Nyamivirus 1 TaxID=2905609 RepID=A0A8K1XH92_9MONO|nr:MAG: RNA-dependent RNA polymerase [Hangzhou Nyamivirus 1]